MCTHVCNKFTFSQGHNIATVRYTLQALSCAPESYIFRKRERVCVYRARVTNRNGYCSYKRKAYHGEVTVADFENQSRGNAIILRYDETRWLIRNEIGNRFLSGLFIIRVMYSAYAHFYED